MLVKDVHKLFQAGPAAVDDIIPQQYGKGLIADKIPGAEDGVPQTEGLLLADLEDVHHFVYLAHLLQGLLFAFFLQM